MAGNLRASTTRRLPRRPAEYKAKTFSPRTIIVKLLAIAARSSATTNTSTVTRTAARTIVIFRATEQWFIK